MAVCVMSLLAVMGMRVFGIIKGRVFIVMLIISSLCLCVGIGNELFTRREIITEIKKNPVGVGDTEKDLIATVDNKKIPLEITVPQATITPEKAEEILDMEAKALEKRILGENKSLEHINKDMTLVTTGENQKVDISWVSSDSSIINFEGKIGRGIDSKGEQVTLMGIISLQQQERRTEFNLRVFPRGETGDLKKDLRDTLEEENFNEDGSSYILPDKLGERDITWQEASDNSYVIIAFLIPLTGLLLFLSEKKKIADKEKQRKEILEGEYPEFVTRLLLMMYAGISLRNAFYQMAADQNSREGELLKEVKTTVAQMEKGETEIRAYENMADRCDLSCYRGLGVILSQSLQHGNRDIVGKLEGEVRDSQEDKKRRALEMGDKASMRLLLPLGIMLLIALALILIPAFFSL